MKTTAIRCILTMLAVFFSVSALSVRAQEKELTIGYQLIFNPWKVAIARGDVESATGYRINWRKFDSPGKLLPAMASGDVQIGLLGSTGVATAMSRGINVELVWIAEGIAAAEALVVRNGSGIVAPQDLKGKKLAVPFVSTTHFHTLFALEQFGIAPSALTIINLPPNGIAAAWERGDIDAAFVWDPALSRIKRTGKVLITSGELGRWGKPTFDGIVANRDFARSHAEFMVGFIDVLARTDAEYRDNPGGWTPDSPQVKAIVGQVGGDPADVPGVLASYVFPTLAEQASCDWLGCGKDGGAARALQATAEFLKSEKKIPAVLSDYSKFVNPEWVRAALDRRR
jgi:taurine transport system substrate-binding protein